MDELYSLYRKDKKKRYIIEAKVEDIKDIFNSYDPSPLFQRDLDKNLVERIMGEVVIFPLNSKLVLHLHLPKKYKGKGMESHLRKAFKSYFTICAIDAKFHIKGRLRRGFNTLFIGMVIFAVSFSLAWLIKPMADNSFVINLLIEGFIIGGWIAMWQPVATLFYEWLPLYGEHTKCRKVSKMDIEIKYF